jgi:glycosyltransferase involved in cell wall biosynthesis
MLAQHFPAPLPSPTLLSGVLPYDATFGEPGWEKSADLAGRSVAGRFDSQSFMKIVVVEPDGAGGMCHYAYMLCDALAGAEADATLVTATDYELAHLPHRFTVEASLRLWPRATGSRPLQFLPGLIRVPALAVRRGWRAVKLFVEFWRLTGRLRRRPPDVILLRHLVVPGGRLIMSRLQSTGAVIGQVVHEVGFRDETGLAKKVIARFELRDFAGIDVIFVHNQFVRDKLVAMRGVDPGRIHLIAHGEGSIFGLLDESLDREVAERYGLAPEDRLILMFGEIRSSKGSDDLLHAAALLPLDLHAKTLVAGLVGREVDPAWLPTLVGDLALGDRVILDFRYVPTGEVAALMRRAAVVAFPYRSATQSGVLATAVTFGKPVVVSSVGGLPDVVIDGGNGLVVPPADPPALADALSRILGDPELAAAMSEASVRMRERYSWSNVAANMLGALRQAMDSHSLDGG